MSNIKNELSTATSMPSAQYLLKNSDYKKGIILM